MDDRPELDDMIEAGMSLTAALAFWNKMMREPSREPKFWWTALRIWRQHENLLQ